MRRTRQCVRRVGVLALVCVLLLTACGSSPGVSLGGAEETESTDAEQTFQLKLAHELAEDHAVHLQLTAFAQAVEEASDGTIQIEIFPNGTLGTEEETLEEIQSGALEMAKVSSSVLGSYAEVWDAVSVPYVFRDREHYYQVMDGELAQELYASTEEEGFLGLTWLDSGARSFYTIDTPIRTPADVQGLKIRTMDSQMAVEMMEALGGSAVIMDYANVGVALEQGLVDGAENNVTALRDHGASVGYYSYDEHTRIPDVVVISTQTWNAMSQRQRQIMTDCAREASEAYKTAWQEFEAQVLEEIGDQVELIQDVDTQAFRSACQPIYDRLEQEEPEAFAVVQRIQTEY